MKAVIYARYSDASQREESIEGQLRECKEYAEKNGIMVIGTYIDRALSAKTDNRPEFQRMIRDSAKKVFDMVLVWKLDRFSRNRYDSANYKNILKKNGVKVVSACENISEGPEGIILESLLEGMAEYYSAELSQKIHRGQHENALKGKNNGGGIPLGYQLNHDTQKLEINETEATIVREVFTRYTNGEKMSSIISDFNTRGLRTKKGRAFKSSSFNVILNNRKYIGEYRYQDVVIPGGIPAIVSEDIFTKAQKIKQKNRRIPGAGKAEIPYLLTTKLFCGYCGGMMIGDCGTSHTGTIYSYYKCQHAKRGNCKNKAVPKNKIEELVVYYTVNKVLREDVIDRIANQLVILQQRQDPLIPSLQKQLDDTNKSLENIVEAISQGLITPSVKEKLEQLEKTKDAILLSLTKAQLDNPVYSKEDIIKYISSFKGGDVHDKVYQRSIINTFINSVYVFDDRIVLTYNYKYEEEIIPLDQIHLLSSDAYNVVPPEQAGL